MDRDHERCEAREKTVLPEAEQGPMYRLLSSLRWRPLREGIYTILLCGASWMAESDMKMVRQHDFNRPLLSVTGFLAGMKILRGRGRDGKLEEELRAAVIADPMRFAGDVAQAIESHPFDDDDEREWVMEHAQRIIREAHAEHDKRRAREERYLRGRREYQEAIRRVLSFEKRLQQKLENDICDATTLDVGDDEQVTESLAIYRPAA